MARYVWILLSVILANSVVEVVDLTVFLNTMSAMAKSIVKTDQTNQTANVIFLTLNARLMANVSELLTFATICRIVPMDSMRAVVDWTHFHAALTLNA